MGHDQRLAEEKQVQGEDHRYLDENHCLDPQFHKDYEIADICFGRQQISEASVLMELYPYYKDVVTYEHKLNAAKGESAQKNVEYYLKQYEDLFEKQLLAARKKLG
jgi:uncharacterized protein YihD (DUF1040 family)